MEKISLVKKENKSIFRFSFFLILLLPVMLITGPLLPEIILLVLIISLIITVYKNKDYYIFGKYYFNIFLLFYLYLVVISFFSDSLFLSLKSSLFYIRFGFFYLAVCYFLEHKEHCYKKNIYFLFFILVLIFFDAIFQINMGFNIFNQKLIQDTRASSFFGDELIMGSYVVRILPIFVSIIYYFKIKKLINLLPLLWFISIGTILLSGEKNALGLGIILTCIYFLCSDFSYKKKIAGLLLLIFACYAMLSTVPQIKKRIYTQAKLLSVHGHYGIPTVHYFHYRTAYAMFVDKPFFGHGPKSFRVKCKDTKFNFGKWSCSTHPHNMYMQLLSETGIMGFLFIFWLWIYCSFRLITLLVKGNKNNYYHQFNIFVTAGVFINLFPISTSGNIFNNWVSFIYFMSIALFLYSLKNTETKNV